MADEHRTSSFPETPPRALSRTETGVLQPKPQQRPTVENIIGYLKEKGFSTGKKSVWYKLGSKKRAKRPPMKFSVGAGRMKGSQGAGFRFKVDF